MVTRGGVYFLEHPEWGRRPVLVLTRQAAIPVLKRVTVASISTRIRNIPTEVVLDERDTMPRTCAVSLDNVADVWKVLLVEQLTTLSPERMQQVCDALAVAVGCEA